MIGILGWGFEICIMGNEQTMEKLFKRFQAAVNGNCLLPSLNAQLQSGVRALGGV